MRRISSLWLSILLGLIPTESGVALASSSNNKFRSAGRGFASNSHIFDNGSGGSNVIGNSIFDFAISRGGATKSKSRSDTSTQAFATNTAGIDASILEGSLEEKRPLKVLFLSSDTGGGHRASAEALGKQFLIQYPGSTYELADLWTDHGVLPYRTLVNTYKHMSAHPLQWKIFYHLSNTKLNEVCANLHSKLTCGRRIKDRLESHDPDVIISVHPTMNHTPLVKTQQLSKELGKHIPFFTVVTDLGSGHCMWFEKNVDKLYVASDRLYKLARRRGGTPPERLVLTGLPIRHGFAVQAEQLGDRTSPQGKDYQRTMKVELGMDGDKPMVLVMGGGEGVGSLSDIVNELYAELYQQGVDATICVVCGRNEKLKEDLLTRDFNQVVQDVKSKRRTGRKRRFLSRIFRRKAKGDLEEMVLTDDSTGRGQITVVPLGFVSKVPEYMVAADILVSKAGPGTIAEAASVGLPVMMTSFLPGQEAGNVEVVLEKGFGAYKHRPAEIANVVTSWLQNDELMASMSKAALAAGNPYAADEIVRDIGQQTVAWMNLNEK
ncbi:monogalactosyldiacylglycerol synthase family protein [Nitzschia inconspicua]|uniref:monogalactosyldiacylglycerol synthase n=1 Tax=Nitzschia inconspicua TaxID=303405 RepID=A0A9K3Q7N8_9STRA|nr:monogalactosyldiacylglycerol synthase family protein [Nitzschia inconspicua]